MVTAGRWPDGAGLRLGLVLPTVEGWLGPGRTARWADLREIARLAEAVGVDCLWVADHFLYRSTPGQPMAPAGESRGMWEGFTLLGALAAATERVRIGPLVACTTFRNPALLAKLADALDEVSSDAWYSGWVPAGSRSSTAPSASPTAARLSASSGSRRRCGSPCRSWARVASTSPGGTTRRTPVCCARVGRPQADRRS